MNSLHSRKLLQMEDETVRATVTPITTFYSPDSTAANGNNSTLIFKKSLKSNAPFDSSMALTILVLFTALFFMGFFSIYIRCFADDGGGGGSSRGSTSSSSDNNNLRQRNHSSSLPSWSRSNRKGVDPTVVNLLPLVAYGGEAEHLIGDCSICLSEFEEREMVKMIPYCGHVFHPTCIDTWLTTHVTCPLCRSSKLLACKEKSLGTVEVIVEHGVGEWDRSLEVQDGDTWSGVGSVSMRRTCSCSSITETGTLQRSTSSSF